MYKRFTHLPSETALILLSSAPADGSRQTHSGSLWQKKNSEDHVGETWRPAAGCPCILSSLVRQYASPVTEMSRLKLPQQRVYIHPFCLPHRKSKSAKRRVVTEVFEQLRLLHGAGEDPSAHSRSAQEVRDLPHHICSQRGQMVSALYHHGVSQRSAREVRHWVCAGGGWVCAVWGAICSL